MNDSLEAAQEAARRGWRPFPLDHPALPECIGPRPCDGKRGKHPAVKWGTATAIEAPDALLATWFNGSPRNIGIACKPSSLFVIDEDDRPLDSFAAERGERLPITYRVRTRRGWHSYWRANPDGPLGNAAGGLAVLGADVRGGGATYGGYVVGAGSVHESGHVYAAEDPFVEPADLPEWLAVTISARAQREPGRLRNARAGSAHTEGWDDLPRKGTVDALTAQYARRLGEVRSPSGEFRHELYLAALDGWRLVNCGLKQEGDMLAELAAAVERVWQADPDANDKRIVLAEAKGKASLSPWIVVAESELASDDQGGEGDSTPYEAALAAEIRKERIRREARAALAAEDAVPLRRLKGTDFLMSQRPTPLIPGLFYTDSLAMVFGAEGTGKSLFMLDVALSLAAGVRVNLGGAMNVTASLGEGRPLAVHYVMAEGQATNVERAHAWLAYRELNEDAVEQFVAFPDGFPLTPEGVNDYLTEVEQDRPALVILDTKNAMMEGNENYASDTAVLVRAMHLIRRVSGSCVLIVDHTGKHDKMNSRGGPALKAAMDTQHRIEVDKDTGIHTVWCERDKAAEAGGHWSYQLKPVGESVVLAPTSGVERAIAPFGSADGWWHHDPLLVPDEIAALDGRGSDTARDVFRVLRYVGEVDGLTTAQIWSVLSEGPTAPSKASYYAALAVLKDAGVLVEGKTPARMALAVQFGELAEATK